MFAMLLACSGPGAGRKIQEAAVFSQECAIVIALLFFGNLLLAAWKTKSSALLWPMFILLVLNPAWTTSPRRGDCGDLTTFAASVVLTIGVLVTLLHLVLARWPGLFHFRRPAAPA